MSRKVIDRNKKAFHEFEILEKYEAGITLYGTEVKALRQGRANLKDSFCRVRHGEVYLHNMHIAPYEMGNRENHDPTRVRKLLLHKEEIAKLVKKTELRGFTLIPLQIYFTRGLAKVEIALAKGKQVHDKRESIKRKQMERDAARELKGVK